MVSKTLKTGFRSLTYRSGAIYNFFNNGLYDQKKKYMTISNLIGKNKTVLDLACGTGKVANYLDPSNDYEGWDLNHRFLKKVIKNRKIGLIKAKKFKLKHKNIFDLAESDIQKDVIVIVGVLHHVLPRHVELVEIVKKHAKKLVVLEPIVIRPEDLTTYHKAWQYVMNIVGYFPNPIYKLMDFFFADNDGINSFHNREQWQHDEQSLKEFFKSLGFTKTYKILDELIAVWKR